ncbi:hypothetical protein LTR85_005197 [Meristemomyces frigidus]|nr:hypothetical protein LTR85_005197 [Meristemomyces frigidus]
MDANALLFAMDAFVHPSVKHSALLIAMGAFVSNSRTPPIPLIAMDASGMPPNPDNSKLKRFRGSPPASAFERVISIHERP